MATASAALAVGGAATSAAEVVKAGNGEARGSEATGSGAAAASAGHMDGAVVTAVRSAAIAAAVTASSLFLVEDKECKEAILKVGG